MRVLHSVGTILLVVGLLPAAPAIADDGQKNAAARRAADRPRAGSSPRAAPVPAFSQAGIAQRYQRVLGESRRRDKSIERACQRLERDLAHLQRARTLIVHRTVSGRQKDAPDPILVQVSRIRLRVRQSAVTSRTMVRKAVVVARQSFRRLERQRPLPARADGPAESVAATAFQRIHAAVQVFQRAATVERKQVVQLAQRTAESARQRLQGGGALSSGRQAPPSIDARRALVRLRQMEATRRQTVKRQMERDAQRIKNLRGTVVALEKRLRAVEEEIRRLKRLKRLKRQKAERPDPVKRPDS